MAVLNRVFGLPPNRLCSGRFGSQVGAPTIELLITEAASSLLLIRRKVAVESE